MPYRKLLLLISYSLLFPAGESTGATFSIDWSGSGSFGSVPYRKIIDSLRKNDGDPDTAARLFRLGAAWLKSGDTASALSCFGTAPLRDPALNALAWEAIGDALAKKYPDSAVGCYENVFNSRVPARYRARILNKLGSIVQADSQRICVPEIRVHYSRWWQSHRPLPPDLLCNLIDSLIRRIEWRTVDSLVLRQLTSLSDNAQTVVIHSVNRANPPDSVLSTQAFFLLARIGIECRDYPIAERMLEVAKRKPDFKEQVGERRYLRVRGRLLFLDRRFDEAAATLSTYLRRCGYEADMALLAARAFKLAGDVDKAAYWYDRFIARTPHYPGLAELLWRRAWIEEARGHCKAAQMFYHRIYTSFPRSARSEESYYRDALCCFQLGRWDSALSLLARFESTHPASSLLPAVRFWKAKCRIRLEMVAEAKADLVETVRSDPWDYYAHRARSLLATLGDSSSTVAEFDTIQDTGRAIRWLDSLSSSTRRPLTFEDSINMRRGVESGTVGNFTDAEIFLDPLEYTYGGNLSLEFRIGMFYQCVGAFAQATLAGRRLFGRLPEECRPSMPLPAHRLLFPLCFSDIVAAQARQWNLDPGFILAVMRQESTYNPEVVSPAGAIGLMQIMPATGRTIARELGESFDSETLYIPSVNIRYGSYYLRQLLNQFENSRELTLAGYNGGPPHAREWSERNKEKDPDLLVEGIDFSETRNYVKKVMANYWQYGLLLRGHDVLSPR